MNQQAECDHQQREACAGGVDVGLEPGFVCHVISLALIVSSNRSHSLRQTDPAVAADMGPRPGRSPPERDAFCIRQRLQSIQPESIPELLFCHKQKEDEFIARFAVSRLVWLAMCERECLLGYKGLPCCSCWMISAGVESAWSERPGDPLENRLTGL